MTRTKEKRGLANHEIVTLAVFLTGGDSKTVDTEDVAVKANELAPGRFTWRKYKDQINIEIVRAFLSDAKKPKYGCLLTGAGKNGWMLTEAGVQFVRQHVDETKHADLAKVRLSKAANRLLRFKHAEEIQITDPRLGSSLQLLGIPGEHLKEIIRKLSTECAKSRTCPQISRMGRQRNPHTRSSRR